MQAIDSVTRESGTARILQKYEERVWDASRQRPTRSNENITRELIANHHDRRGSASSYNRKKSKMTDRRRCFLCND